ncbi:hypothetical protein BP6252_10700 [Coleophoma cylindrospora]|uniref:Uncharacterized protein n=1 Tax=Coleophoma cylindrospora TaxID=1849047 RepID=A0A3D8QTD4_9HELO|nr:hypothetical protein BP6252_10700 [Coleophoma cylindrospora]
MSEEASSEHARAYGYSIPTLNPGLQELFDNSTGDKSNTVDYVLIHGFNGSSETTWLHEKPKPKFFWPKRLEVDLKDSRVFVYGYDAALRLSLQQNSISIGGLAEGLFAALIDARSDTNRRPIVFVAHSLGGLVLKRAILDMHQSIHSRETLTNSAKLAQGLYESISGLIFFGTPHLGSRIDEKNRVQVLKGLIGSFATIPKNLTKALVSESVELGDLSKFFEKTKLYTDGKISIRSFFETITRAVYGTVITTKASANLHYASEEMVPIERTHEGMVKFASPDDQYYKATLAVMRRYGQEGLKRKREQDHPPVKSSSNIPSYPLTSIMPVKTFVQRTTLRNQIHEQLHRSLGEELEGETSKVGVWGLGGTGKSQLVRSYLRRYQADYNATFWIEAGQTTSINRDFLQIYYLLTKAPSQSNSPSPEEALRAVHTWFIGRGGRWLFVFDGADQLEDESDLHFVNISRYIPGSPNVQVIIISRSSIAKKLSTFEGVSVGELEGPQAEELFFKCSEIKRSEIAMTEQIVVNQVKLIVKELGYLALAVTLAGSYFSQTPRLSTDLHAYLVEYRIRRHQILSEPPNELINQYKESVMTAWEISYSAVEKQMPEAGRFLTLLAFLNYDDIFLDLFPLKFNPTPISQHSWATVIWEQDQVSIGMVEKCCAILEKHSLLQRQETRAAYSMHKLVHSWGSDRLLLQERWEEANKFCTGAFQLLFEAVSNCVNTPEAKLRLVPHIRQNFDAIQKPGRVLGIDSFIHDLEYIGDFLSDIGQWHDAAVMRQEVFTMRQRDLGEDDPNTISAMNNLAITLIVQGQRAEAAKMFKEVLEKRQILGEHHTDTISSMSNLANILRDQGQYTEAEKMEKEVLEKRRQILGEDHLNTISAMNNLAITLRVQGQLDEAAKMEKEVLEKRRRILGKNHPNTISSMSNLANILTDQGQHAEAAKMKKEVLEKRGHILGEDHPDTISAMSSLAITLRDQRQLNEAAKMFKKVLEKRKQILSEDHPDTISSMSNLANVLRDQRQLDEAAKMFKEVLEKMRRILGEDHPNTISSMSNLANTLGDQGQHAEAAKMEKEVLEKRRRILREDHPDTISAMNNLAITLRHQGQLGESISLLDIAVRKMKQIHGDEHPHTKVAIRNLDLSRAIYKTVVIDSGKKQDKVTTLYTRIKRRFHRKAL